MVSRLQLVQQLKEVCHMPDVHYTVNTCKYWQNSNLCHAQQIVMQSDAAGVFRQMQNWNN
jgi:hypothetical protein